MSTPFTYLIGWSSLGLFYYGVRYRAGCHPNDLFSKYFTSSKLVHQCIIDHGMPDVIEVRRVFKFPKQALVWEQKVLRRLKVLYNNKWLNKNVSGAIEFDERIRKLMSEAKKGCVWVHKEGRKMLIRKELLSTYLEDGFKRGHGQSFPGPLNGMYGKHHTEETKATISANKRGVRTITPLGSAAKSLFMRNNNPMHNPEIKQKYDEVMESCRRSSKYVYFNGVKFESLRAAHKEFPHIKYSTLAYKCTHKKDGWSYDPPVFLSESAS